MKTTLREIKGFNAIDVTYYRNDDLYKLEKEEAPFKDIAYSMGVYGCNGFIIQGKSGTYYKVTSRTNALFILM